MQEIRQWAFGICAAAIACGLVQLILPKSGMQRIFQVTASVFFLGCLFAPLAFTVSFDLDFAYEQQRILEEVKEKSERLRGAVQEESNAMVSESVRQAAQQVLQVLGVEYRKIYINVHDDAEDGISISECEVELDARYFPRHDEIRAALLEKLGVNVVIGYKE